MSDESAPAWAVPLIKSLGNIEGKLDSLSGSFATHVEDDRRLGARVMKIETAIARQRGAVRVWGVIATAAASIAGAVVSWWLDHRSH